MDQALFSTVGIALILAGFAIAFIAVLLMILTAARGDGRVRGGGAVIIGPFPIIFGTDKESVKLVLLLSLALIAVMLIFIAFSYYTPT